MSVIFVMFTFHEEKEIKTNKNNFCFGRGPTRFNLAPTYLHQRWRIRVTWFYFWKLLVSEITIFL